MSTFYRDTQAVSFKVELLRFIEALPLKTRDSADKFQNLESEVQSWIGHIRSIPDQTGHWLYLLQSSSKTDLSINGLSPTDLARFRSLQALESYNHFNVFLAQVEKRAVGTRSDYNEYACEEVDESENEEDGELQNDVDSIDEIEWTVRVLFDANGGRNPHKLDLNPEAVLQGDVFQNCEPDEEGELPDGYDEHTQPGLYGFYQYYRSLAFLMVPQSTTVTYFSDVFLRNGNIDPVADMLEYFSSKCIESGGDEKSFEILTRLCEDFLPQQDTKVDSRIKFSERVIAKVLEAAIRFQSRGLFELACNNIEVKLSPQFFSWIASKLEGSNLSLTMLSPALEESALILNTLGDRYKYILSMNTTSDKSPKALRRLALGVLDKMVDFCYTSTLYEQDGEILVFIACDIQDHDWLFKRISPLVYDKREHIAFILGFSWQLYSSARHNKLPITDPFGFLRYTLKSLVARLDVAQLISEEGFQYWQQQRANLERNHNGQNEIKPPPPPVTSRTLSNLCILLLDLGLEGDLRYLARMLTAQSQRIDLGELAYLFLPFVGNLMDIIEKRSISLGDPVFSALIRVIIKLFWYQWILCQLPRGYSNAMLNRHPRVVSARSQLAAFDKRRLRIVLREDYYDIMGVDGSHPGYEAAPLTVQPARSAGTSMQSDVSRHMATVPQTTSLPNRLYRNFIPTQGFEDGLPRDAEFPPLPIFSDEPRNYQACAGQRPQQHSTHGLGSPEMPSPVAHPPPIASVAQVHTADLPRVQEGSNRAGQHTNPSHSEIQSRREALASLCPNLALVTGTGSRQIDGFHRWLE
ncbi:hypothetical protein F4677DRAFT_461632 [Hypoxylon crocopeplum]|nr:hypothetical protein F4677DRAFT_461632 [Hypoxylon crocopeplum]